MSYADISREIEDLYAFNVSTATISTVTDKLSLNSNSGSNACWSRLAVSDVQKLDNLSAYFRYLADIRKVIYTTNAIKSVHRQFRKVTKTKGAFPNENSLLKLLYLGLLNAQ